jgi:hypothetical protein
MRLPQSVLSRLKQAKKPQRKFVAHLLGLMLMLPGHATFRNMSRYSPYHERSFARWPSENDAVIDGKVGFYSTRKQ